MLRRTLLLVALVSAAAEPVRAQTLAELTATPEATADAFLRSVRAIRWEATGRLIHSQTLDRFQILVSMIAAADTTGDAGRRILWSDELEVLDAALRGVTTGRR